MIHAKICGLTRTADALLAVEAGARYLGFIFAPSKRRVRPQRVAEIVAGLGAPANVDRVGVFVNESPAEIGRVVAEAGLTVVQLHGDETPEDCVVVRERAGVPVIKALRLRREDEETLAGLARHPADFLMIEPYVEGLYGGTGRTADWGLAAELVAAHPQRRFFLAGGLSPENVGEACRRVAPYAVDVSSGLEVSPGVKQPEKIASFMEVIRSL